MSGVFIVLGLLIAVAVIAVVSLWVLARGDLNRAGFAGGSNS